MKRWGVLLAISIAMILAISGCSDLFQKMYPRMEGVWDVLLTVEATHAVEIRFDIKEQVCGEFDGYVLKHVEPQGDLDGTVTICGKVELDVVPYADEITYKFSGTARGDHMEGTVVLSHPGQADKHGVWSAERK